MPGRAETGHSGSDDDRPPICPACGVTMGIALDERGRPRHVCLECGFGEGPGDRPPGRRAGVRDDG